ncbi:hypothetical protein FF80_01882 [Devosia sp. LC5]|uniref:hypothetical protein n=1 Tax=Devosia sp. LC5 TaxID=1502724 RepID=UPI0004E3A8C4|nr:hypothetical protein [Devosia sp. LC5]KFC68442.1 hypothetical protein FF80_01882 [Devosia sp. LC5]
MTAINALVTSDAAHMFTDGGLYGQAEGKLVSFGTKVQLFPHLNAVAACSGWAHMGYVIWDALSDRNFQSFDELAAGFGDAIRVYLNRETWTHRDFFEAVLAGWSESADEPQVWVVQNAANNTPAYVPRQVSETTTPYNLAIGAVVLDPSDPVTYGLSVLEKQRSEKWDTANGSRSIHAVGGFAQHTIVDRSGIKTRVLRRWPDKVGEPVAL